MREFRWNNLKKIGASSSVTVGRVVLSGSHSDDDPKHPTGLINHILGWLKRRVSGRVFSGIDFRSCRLDGGQFTDCSFRDCVFDECDFGDCAFFKTEFDNCEFRGGDARAAVFGKGCIFTGCLFAELRLRGAGIACVRIESSRFLNCDMKKLHFDSVILSNCSFSGTLDEVEFHGSGLGSGGSLNRVDFSDAKLKHPRFWKILMRDCLLPEDENIWIAKRNDLECAIGAIDIDASPDAEVLRCVLRIYLTDLHEKQDYAIVYLPMFAPRKSTLDLLRRLIEHCSSGSGNSSVESNGSSA